MDRQKSIKKISTFVSEIYAVKFTTFDRFNWCYFLTIIVIDEQNRETKEEMELFTLC